MAVVIPFPSWPSSSSTPSSPPTQGKQSLASLRLPTLWNSCVSFFVAAASFDGVDEWTRRSEASCGTLASDTTGYIHWESRFR